jgi:RNA-directed DNA polymerase
VDLCARLRSKQVLHRAWAAVKASGLSSVSVRTIQRINSFDENWINNLARIARRLKAGTFDFVDEVGIAPPKGRGKQGRRPIVLAPIENRIVRRAILEVLQGYGEAAPKPRNRWSGIPAIRKIMDTRTSVGGIRGRGVSHGLSLIDLAVREGQHFFVRSDIKDFFTRIPITKVNDFVRDAVADEKFAALFEKALATNLINKEELEDLHLLKLFPDDETGVAQGSALSALAGNITLKEFDAAMNGRGILCVRYIDDFILLGSNYKNVLAAYRSARSILRQMGMDVYDLDDTKACRAGKVDAGTLHEGTNVLGYRISGRSRQPCPAACKNFLQKIDQVVTDAKREMAAAAHGTSSSHLHRYHQSMVMVHKITWGWSQSFCHTTAGHVFESLDRQIDIRIEALQREARNLAKSGSADVRRRVMGVHLLKDTRPRPLPEVRPSAAIGEAIAA